MIEVDDVDVHRYVSELPSVMQRAVDEAQKRYQEKVTTGAVNADNFGDWAVKVVEVIVNEFDLLAEDELVNGEVYQILLHHLLTK